MTSTWLHSLPVWAMALVVFGVTSMAAAVAHVVTRRLALGRHGKSYMSVSPGLLSPVGIIFGLFIAFTAAQVWNDTTRASIAIDSEAGALRSVVVMSAVLPQDAQNDLRKLVRDYIEYTANVEWPQMAHGALTLNVSPPALNRALQLTLSLSVATPGQQTAQREIATSIEQALEARRQRVLISRTEVSVVKWAGLAFLAMCLLMSIGVVHSGDRLTSAVALALFSAALATAMLLILAHDRPFTGDIALTPEPLLQVMPSMP